MPENNRIMTGTGWVLALVLSASRLSARSSEWQLLLVHICATDYESEGRMLFVACAHHLRGSRTALDLLGLQKNIIRESAYPVCSLFT